MDVNKPWGLGVCEPAIPALRGLGWWFWGDPCWERLPSLHSDWRNAAQWAVRYSRFSALCNSCAFRSSFICRLLFDLASFVGSFVRVLSRTCWRSTNATAILKGILFLKKKNFCPIRKTPTFSKVFKKIISHKLSGCCDILTPNLNIYFFALSLLTVCFVITLSQKSNSNKLQLYSQDVSRLFRLICRMNDLSCAVFDSSSLNGFNGTVSRSLLPARLTYFLRGCFGNVRKIMFFWLYC